MERNLSSFYGILVQLFPPIIYHLMVFISSHLGIELNSLSCFHVLKS